MTRDSVDCHRVQLQPVFINKLMGSCRTVRRFSQVGVYGVQFQNTWISDSSC